MKKLMVTMMAVATSTAAWACTSLIATPGATADGSSIVTYAADSHTLYGELYHQPAADHPAGAKRQVIDWDSGTHRGEIDEVAHTYATLGNMNEHGLTISESTWGGREELEGSGLIDYGSLIYITLQRARTAREAIDVMAELVDRYGYGSEGESFSIGDPNEVWIMELIGKGKSDPGAVWVARRVPDGYISGHANHSRIHTFPLDNTPSGLTGRGRPYSQSADAHQSQDNTPSGLTGRGRPSPQSADAHHSQASYVVADGGNTLYSKDVIDFARQQGYYDGKDEDFDFSRAYAVYDMGALRGCDARVWSYFNRFNGDMYRYMPWITEGRGEILPLWVKPDTPVTTREMKWMMRDHFEGTPLDMTTDIGAGPFDCPYRWRPLTYEVDGKEYTHERAIATQQTGFSFVSDMNAKRPEGMRGVLWFGVDDANTCAYVPVFSSITRVPHQLEVGNGDMYNISWDAMFWTNNYVANQAYNRYSQMIPDIRRVQQGLEGAMEMDVENATARTATMDAAAAQRELQSITDYWAARVTREYKDLGDYLLVKYLDGNIKKEVDGQFARTETGMPVYPVFGGYNDRYYRSIVNETGDKLLVKPVE